MGDFDDPVFAEEPAVKEALEVAALERRVHVHEPKPRTFGPHKGSPTAPLTIQQTGEVKQAEICACGAWKWSTSEAWTESNYPSNAQLAVNARRKAALEGDGK